MANVIATGVHRLHNNGLGRASGSISKLQGPKVKNLWDLDGESTTITRKRSKVAQQELNDSSDNISKNNYSFGDIYSRQSNLFGQTGKQTMDRLHIPFERTSGTSSQMREPKTNNSEDSVIELEDMLEEKEVPEQKIGIGSQIGVCLFPSSSSCIILIVL